MFDKVDIVDGCVILGGVTLSLSNTHHILSIIILIIDVLWLGLKFIVKLCRYIKNGDDLDELDNDINIIKDVITKVNEKGDDNE